MPLFILDTDVFSLFREQHPEVVRRVQATPPDQLAIAVIIVEEVLGGWYTALRKVKQPDAIEFAYGRLAAAVGDFTGVTIRNFTRTAIARFEALRKQKLNVGANDLRIAAIALEAGAVVVTRNVRDFQRVPNLAVEDWTQPVAP
jgi:tRNA(fMet)-specific endonuclease VapC